MEAEGLSGDAESPSRGRKGKVWVVERKREVTASLGLKSGHLGYGGMKKQNKEVSE